MPPPCWRLWEGGGKKGAARDSIDKLSRKTFRVCWEHGLEGKDVAAQK